MSSGSCAGAPEADRFALLTGYAGVCSKTHALLEELHDHWRDPAPDAHVSAFMFGHFDLLDVAVDSGPAVFQRVPVPVARQPDWIEGAFAPGLTQLQQWARGADQRGTVDELHPAVVSAATLVRGAARPGPTGRPLLACCAVRLQDLGLLLRAPAVPYLSGSVGGLLGSLLASRRLQLDAGPEAPIAGSAANPTRGTPALQIAPLISLNGSDLTFLVSCATAEQGLAVATALRRSSLSLLCPVDIPLATNLGRLLGRVPDAHSFDEVAALQETWRQTPLVRTTITGLGIPLHPVAPTATPEPLFCDPGAPTRQAFGTGGDPRATAIRSGFIHSTYRMAAGSEARGIRELTRELEAHLGAVPPAIMLPLGPEQARAYRWPYERDAFKGDADPAPVSPRSLLASPAPVELEVLLGLTRRFGTSARVERLSEVSLLQDWDTPTLPGALQPDLLDELHDRLHAARARHLGATDVGGVGLLRRWQAASKGFVPTALERAVRELLLTAIARLDEDLCGVAPILGMLDGVIAWTESERTHELDAQATASLGPRGSTPPTATVRALDPRGCRQLDSWRRHLMDALEGTRAPDGFAVPAPASHRTLDVRSTQRLGLQGYWSTLDAALHCMGLGEVRTLVTSSVDQAAHCQAAGAHRALFLQVPADLLTQPDAWQIPLWVARAALELTTVADLLERPSSTAGRQALANTLLRPGDFATLIPAFQHSIERLKSCTIAEAISAYGEGVLPLRDDLIGRDLLEHSDRTFVRTIRLLERLIRRVPENLVAAEVAQQLFGRPGIDQGDLWWHLVGRHRAKDLRFIERPGRKPPSTWDDPVLLSGHVFVAIEIALVSVLLTPPSQGANVALLTEVERLFDRALSLSQERRPGQRPPAAGAPPAERNAHRLVEGLCGALEERADAPGHRATMTLLQARNLIVWLRHTANRKAEDWKAAQLADDEDAWSGTPEPTPAAIAQRQFPVLPQLLAISQALQGLVEPAPPSHSPPDPRRHLMHRYQQRFVDPSLPAPAPRAEDRESNADQIAMAYCHEANQLSGLRGIDPLCDFLARKSDA